MPDLAAGDVTYTINKQTWLPDGGYRNFITIAFGNGALTYPAGGVPLTKGKMGCPTTVTALTFIEKNFAADGFDVDYDLSAEKFLMYKYDYSVGTDGGKITLVATTDTPAATSIECIAEGY